MKLSNITPQAPKINARPAVKGDNQMVVPYGDEIKTESKDGYVKIAGEMVPIIPTTTRAKIGIGMVAAGGAWMAANIAQQAASAGWQGAAVVAGAAIAGYVASDFASGIFHHAMDNYAKPDKPGEKETVIGEMAGEFLAHHYYANSMEQMTVLNSMDPTSSVFGAAMLGLGALNPHYAVATAALTMMGGAIFAQGSHRWTHENETSTPVKLLRTLRIAQREEDHRAHHRAPWTGNYCIVNGVLNPLLDHPKVNFWPKYEKFVNVVTGAEPKSWNHPSWRAFANGEISRTELDANYKSDTPQFKENIGFAAEREWSKHHLHTRGGEPLKQDNSK